jgi:hypothetical protein
MNIRSITCFCNPGWPLDEVLLRQAGDFIAAARPTFESAGYPVQTARLASVPFPSLIPFQEGNGRSQDEAIALAEMLSKESTTQGFDYLSLGPALPESPESYAVLPALLASAPNLFLGAGMTDASGRISLPAVRRCADAIHQAAAITPDGFANLRLAALANVPPGTPFFPAAYHAGGGPAFALAMEAAGLAVQAFTEANSLETGRQSLVQAIQDHAGALTALAGELSREHGIVFKGIDFSLAPFPDEGRSLGTAFERMGIPAVGLHGSLAAAAFLADSLDRAHFPRAGFNGLFMPVLEDSVLARQSAEGTLNLKDLLLFSAVCGSGLDTIPLPGDIPVPALAAILLDVATLACRLNKPLTARLMPIPGKKAGDPTGFDFAYFANSRVMDAQAEALRGLLAGDETFDLAPRPSRA